MTDSVYKKTALPARLDLNKRNTREQLQNATDDKRGTLEGAASSSSSAAKSSQRDCNDVMRKDLQTWLVDHGITGPPPSAEAEQRAMWSWIRDFHKEYNDDWYARNMPRLRDQFRPIFMQEIKSMKAKAGQSESTPMADDLLDFGGSQPSKEATPKAVSSASNGEQDLLGFDAPSGGSASLLDVPKASNDLAHGADPFAPATTTSADHGVLDILAGSASSTSDRELSGLKGTAVEALGNDLLNVDLGGYSAQPAVPLAPQAVQQMPVQPQQASPEEKLSQLQQQLAQPSFSNPQPQQPLTQQQQFQQLQQELQHTTLQQQQIQFQALQHELKQPDPRQLQMQDTSFSLLTGLSPAPGGSGKDQAKKEENLFDFNLM